MIIQSFNSKTKRRNLRREVRNILGSSRDSAPTTGQALRALTYMADLVKLATNGRYTVYVYDNKAKVYETPRGAHLHAEAEGIEREF